VRSEIRTDSNLFRVLSRLLLERGIAVRFRAHGRSMFPAIADGDVLEVSTIAPHRAGDVVLVESQDGIRAHRVISSNRERIVTRGDSCLEADAGANPSLVLGRVTRVLTSNRRRSPHTLRTRLRQLFSRVRVKL
jgi:hypothetical protein